MFVVIFIYFLCIKITLSLQKHLSFIARAAIGAVVRVSIGVLARVGVVFTGAAVVEI